MKVIVLMVVDRSKSVLSLDVPTPIGVFTTDEEVNQAVTAHAKECAKKWLDMCQPAALHYSRHTFELGSEMLLVYNLLADELQLFNSWDHDVDAPPMTELQTKQWTLLRDISQLRELVRKKRYELSHQ
jgi:hypothetical protein